MGVICITSFLTIVEVHLVPMTTRFFFKISQAGETIYDHDIALGCSAAWGFVSVLLVLKLDVFPIHSYMLVPCIFGTRGRSLPDILACLGATGSKYIENWKMMV